MEPEVAEGAEKAMQQVVTSHHQELAGFLLGEMREGVGKTWKQCTSVIIDFMQEAKLDLVREVMSIRQQRAESRLLYMKRLRSFLKDFVGTTPSKVMAIRLWSHFLREASAGSHVLHYLQGTEGCSLETEKELRAVFASLVDIFIQAMREGEPDLQLEALAALALQYSIGGRDDSEIVDKVLESIHGVSVEETFPKALKDRATMIFQYLIMNIGSSPFKTEYLSRQVTRLQGIVQSCSLLDTKEELDESLSLQAGNVRELISKVIKISRGDLSCIVAEVTPRERYRTLSLWVSAEEGAEMKNEGVVFFKGRTAGPGVPEIVWSRLCLKDGCITFHLDGSHSVSCNTASLKRPASEDNSSDMWTHVVITLDQEGLLVLYINGEVAGESSCKDIKGQYLIDRSGHPFFFGPLPEYISSSFSCPVAPVYLSQVHLIEHALSQDLVGRLRGSLHGRGPVSSKPPHIDEQSFYAPLAALLRIGSKADENTSEMLTSFDIAQCSSLETVVSVPFYICLLRVATTGLLSKSGAWVQQHGFRIVRHCLKYVGEILSLCNTSVHLNGEGAFALVVQYLESLNALADIDEWALLISKCIVEEGFEKVPEVIKQVRAFSPNLTK